MRQKETFYKITTTKINFFQVRLRESEMQALHEERSKREALERKLQEESMLREELVQQQIKMRDHQVKQVYTNVGYSLWDRNFVDY